MPHFRLLKEVFPTLDGSEHNILIVYFTLTDRVNPDYLFYGLLSKEHIKLLKKIKSACPSKFSTKLITVISIEYGAKSCYLFIIMLYFSS